MTTRAWVKRPGNQIRIGLAFLILASFAKWSLEKHTMLPDPWTDALTGLLYGVAIGSMLLGIWRKGRQDSDLSGSS